MMVYLLPSHTAITTSYIWGVLPFVVVDEGIKLWVNFLVAFSAWVSFDALALLVEWQEGHPPFQLSPQILQRVTYKMASLMFRVFSPSTVAYLRDLMEWSIGQAKILRAIPAWWGFAAASDRQKLAAFLWCGTRLKFYSHHEPNVAELVDELDET